MPSGPLPDEISAAVQENDLAVVSVLSGNRNFEGRINPDVKMNYLASPPLVVAYALAGTMDIDLLNDPIGQDRQGDDVYLRDIWPSEHEIAETIESAVQADMFRKSYGDVFKGDERWQGLDVPTGDRFAWDDESTYVRQPDVLRGPVARAGRARGHPRGARAGQAGRLGHHRPHLARRLDQEGRTRRRLPAGARRRGPRLQLVRVTPRQPRGDDARHVRQHPPAQPARGRGTEGGVTRYLADGSGEQMSIYDASIRYQDAGIPLVILGGKEYGSGSSRDWAAKGTNLLGVKAVIAESFERIHRSNLVGMGVIPLQYADGENAESLGLTGEETFEITGVAEPLNAGEAPPREITVKADDKEFTVRVRIDTPKEALYMRNGGILQYVLRQLNAD